MKNRYKIEGDKVIIYLDRRDGSVIECMTDADQLEKLMTLRIKWYPKWAVKTQSFYVQATRYIGTFNGKPKYENMYMHKFLKGSQKGQDVDHLNHDTLDNRINNLEIKNRSENSLNRTRANKNSSTGVRNVFWDKSMNKYTVSLLINGKHIRFGNFTDLDEAAKVAEQARKEHYKTA